MVFTSLKPQKGVIISGFAGIGKTGLIEHTPYYVGKKIFDLSSSFFRKNLGWEKVYCDIAINLANKYDYVFISTHNMVIDEMLSRGEKFYIVYPKQYCKDEYIEILKTVDKAYIMDIYAARETQGDIDIDINDIIKAIPNAEHITQDEINKLLDYKDSVLLFMSPNDLTSFEQNYINKYHEKNESNEN